MENIPDKTKLIDYVGFSEERPWGRFRIIDLHDKCKVKRVEVEPGKKLSLQSHKQRHEYWTVVTGRLHAIIDGQEQFLEPGQQVVIKAGQVHRCGCPADSAKVVFIEVQLGDYVGEDDITRYEDDFGRANLPKTDV